MLKMKMELSLNHIVPKALYSDSYRKVKQTITEDNAITNEPSQFQ